MIKIFSSGAFILDLSRSRIKQECLFWIYSRWRRVSLFLNQFIVIKKVIRCLKKVNKYKNPRKISCSNINFLFNDQSNKIFETNKIFHQYEHWNVYWYSKLKNLCTNDENNISAPKMRNNFGAIQLFICSISRYGYWTSLYCFLWSYRSYSSLYRFLTSFLGCFLYIYHSSSWLSLFFALKGEFYFTFRYCL